MYYERKLNNGITVVGQQINGFRSVSTGIWIRTGSADEEENESGISHFIEHMLFKGTKNRTARDIAVDMDSIGGILNAFTSKECTCYHARVMDEHLEKSVEILCDIVFNSTIDENEMSKEKGVVLEEINMVEDSPEDLVFEILNKAYYQGNKLANPILGSAETVSSFTREDLINYINRRYKPECMVIAAAGGFDFEKLCDTIEKYSQNIPYNGEACKTERGEAHGSREFSFKEKPIEQAHFAIAMPGYPLQTEELYSASVLNNAFGGSMSSRLFQKIREERGLAYDVYSQPSSYSDVGAFSIYAGVNPQRAPEALTVMFEEIEKVRSEGITEEEFIRSKDQLKGNYILGLESTNARMNAIGKSKLLTGTVKTAEDTLKSIEKVTLDSVNAILPVMFDTNKMTAAAVGKIPVQEFENILSV